MNDTGKCSICGDRVPTKMDWWEGDTCSPECARTKAIVDAIKGIERMIAARLPEVQTITTDPALAADLVSAMDRAGRDMPRPPSERTQ